MTSPIDPIRKSTQLRRRRASDASEAADTEAAVNLPVPAGPARTVPPPQAAAPADAVFSAQLIGQDGQKRGLRGGDPVIDSAKTAYNRTEWSGSRDRRARKGRAARTEI
jgi:hypothetical protein